MLPSPWMQLVVPDTGRTYLALLSFLPLRSLFRLPAFIRYAFAVRRQVEAAPGAVGYSMNQDPLHLHFWTLSVWGDEAHLGSFVEALPHALVMDALQNDMGPTAFVRWEIRGADVPPSWRDALARQSRGPGTT